jgi:hypothetical protein
MLLSGLGGITFIFMTIFVSETHHYHRSRQLMTSSARSLPETSVPVTDINPESHVDVIADVENPNDSELKAIDAKEIAENSDFTESAVSNDNRPSYTTLENDNSDHIIAPSFGRPLEFIYILSAPEFIPTLIMSSISFGCMFTSLTILPIYLAVAPYNLPTGLIGVAFLPVGVAMMAGALAGGYASDVSARRFTASREGRMVYPLALAIGIGPGAIAFGVSLYTQTSLASVLITQAFLGFSQAGLMPAVTSYATARFPERAGTAAAAVFFVCFGGAAILVSVAPQACTQLGPHVFFIIVGSACAASQVLAALYYRREMRNGIDKVAEPVPI